MLALPKFPNLIMNIYVKTAAQSSLQNKIKFYLSNFKDIMCDISSYLFIEGYVLRKITLRNKLTLILVKFESIPFDSIHLKF